MSTSARTGISVWCFAVLTVALTPFLAVAAALPITSEVGAILVSNVAELPRGPNPTKQGDNCDFDFVDPTTAAGRYVQGRGWGVVAEAAIGDYRLVSFAGVFIGGTSGSCAIEQGNVGVFDGAQLKGLLYSAKKSDRLIGRLTIKEDGGLRLWGSDFLRLPVADLVIATDGLVVRELSPTELFCSDTVSVPNVYDIPITDARVTLRAGGWKPVQQPSEEWGQQPDLQALGVIEATSCSGTGFGFCSYEYRGRDASLMVTTAGELFEDNVPSVVGYDVTCN